MLRGGVIGGGAKGQMVSARTAEASAATIPLAAFEEIALPHLHTVFCVARRLGRDDGVAEELTQETFLRALRSFGTFRLTDAGARPWLLKILHNTFFTRRQRERRQPVLLENMDLIEEERTHGGWAETSRGAVDWDHCDEEMKRAVDSLPARQREVLLLWAVEELKYREIAEICGCPLGTVMSTLYRARQMLATLLKGFYAERGVITARCA